MADFTIRLDTLSGFAVQYFEKKRDKSPTKRATTEPREEGRRRGAIVDIKKQERKQTNKRNEEKKRHTAQSIKRKEALRSH